MRGRKLLFVCLITMTALLVGCEANKLIWDAAGYNDGDPEIAVRISVTEDIVADTTGSVVEVWPALHYPRPWGGSLEPQANQPVFVNGETYYTDSEGNGVELDSLDVQPGETVTIEVWTHMRDFSVPYSPLYSAPTEHEVTAGDTLHFAWLQAPSRLTQYLKLSTPGIATHYNSNTDSSDATFVDFIVPADVDSFNLRYGVYSRENDPDRENWDVITLGYYVIGTYHVQQP
ncbi:hypothetical protein KQI52_09670 [bacterium]|nr:hypothetical protein [bacterium]